MARLIDADKLKRFILENGYVYANTLDTFPTIDAVPVVRCKDCKHAFERSERKPFGCYLHEKNGITLHDSDDFCSCGERKNNE